MTKECGVTHFTELHRTLHKNFLIWRRRKGLSFISEDIQTFGRIYRVHSAAPFSSPVVYESSIPYIYYIIAKAEKI